MNYIVREATQLDFEGVYKLLKRLNDTSLSKSDWEKITMVDFKADDNHYGYVIEHDGELLGFLGTIFSKRQLNGQEMNFCNFHSWIVDPTAKTGGMALLLKVLKLKGYILTNFTASKGPYKIFKSLKFKEIAYKNYKLLPLQSAKSVVKSDIQKVTIENAEKLLDQNQLQLYNDHIHFENAQFLTITNNDSRSFVISKRRTYVPKGFNKIPVLQGVLKRNLFLGEIHYISNPEVYFNAFSSTSNAIKICRILGVLGIIVADRYLPETVTLKKKLYPNNRPYFYKHADEDQLIDTLYSEFFVLNF